MTKMNAKHVMGGAKKSGKLMSLLGLEQIIHTAQRIYIYISQTKSRLSFRVLEFHGHCVQPRELKLGMVHP